MSSPEPVVTVLGIETSGEVGSVALLRQGVEPLVHVFEEGLIHGVALAPAVSEVLRGAALKARELSLIAVGTGPGSYTGTRVGVAFAKSLSLAAGVPVVGVPSLDGMADDARHSGEVVCVRDARRGTVYLASYRPGSEGPQRDGPIRLVSVADVTSLLPRNALVIGDAIARFPDLLSGDGRTFGARELWNGSAAAVARLGLRRFSAEGPTDAHELSPIYLRASEAEERRAEKEDQSRG